MDDEIDLSGLKKTVKNISYKGLIAIIILFIAISAFFIGKQVGYEQGYTYVEGWYKEYDQYRICFEAQEKEIDSFVMRDTEDILQQLNIS